MGQNLVCRILPTPLGVASQWGLPGLSMVNGTTDCKSFSWTWDTIDLNFEDRSKTMLGEHQWQWLEDQLRILCDFRLVGFMAPSK
jgi:hypothetical protein